MKQQAKMTEVLKEFEKAKATGRQPVCPYCNKPLEIGQSYSVYMWWVWDIKKKRYQQESDWDGDAPFCDACNTEDWDFTENDLVV